MNFDFGVWFNMALIASLFAIILHIISTSIMAWRLQRYAALYIVLFGAVYTFFSAFIYTILLSLPVALTYATSGSSFQNLDKWLWGLGLGIFYTIIKGIVSGFLK